MNPARLVLLVFRAAIFAALVALPLSHDEFIKLEIWVTVTAAIVAADLLNDVFKTAKLQPANLNVAWNWRRQKPNQFAKNNLRELRSIQATLASAQHNDRSFVNRLRPRLDALAAHFMPIRQAIDPATDPARAQALLGDVAWLIDPEVIGRKPTIGEISKFLDIVLAEQVMAEESSQQRLPQNGKSDGQPHS